MKRIVFSILIIISSVMVSASIANAEEDYASCIKRSIKHLDDKVSPADVVARGVLSACDDILRKDMEKAYPDNVLTRGMVRDSARKHMMEKVIELVLFSRTHGNASSPSDDQSTGPQSFSLGSDFTKDLAAKFHEKPGSTPGRFYEMSGLDGSKLDLIVSDLPGLRRKIINISQSYSVATRKECISKYEKFVRDNNSAMEIVSRPTEDAERDFGLVDPQSYSRVSSHKKDILGMAACSKDGQGYVAQIRVGLKKASQDQLGSDSLKETLNSLPPLDK